MKNIFMCTGHEIKYPDIVRAENCALFDAKGNKYLDLESGVWCTSIGHSHPRITAVIAEQVEKIMHVGYCYRHPIIQKTSEKLLRITGINEGKSVFISSGSEAVEFAVKVIQSISQKPYILTMKDSYLSAFGSSGKKDKDNWILFDWKNNEDLNNIPFGKISAFIFEPGSSSGQVNFPPEKLVHEIVKRVKDNGGLIIANEVTTGMGRTGRWFGYQHYNIIPHIVAMGKGLGSGYPVSSVVLSSEVIEKLENSNFYYYQSHQNDPLGAAVANEVIDVIEEDGLLEKCRENGKEIKDRLNKLKEQYGIIKEVRGRGLMLAIEFEENEKFSYADKINSELLKRNIILVRRPYIEVFRLDPALTIEEEDINLFLSSLESVITGLES